MKNFTENEHVQIWIEDEVVYVLYKKASLIGLNAAKEIVRLRLELQKGKTYNGIAFLSDVNAATPEARRYLAKAGYEGVDKVGIIANSKITILLGNLFILINKPPRPTKLFGKKEDALKWLNSMNVPAA